MRTYIVSGHRPVLDAAPGETLSANLSAEVELEHLNAGRLQVAPKNYRVVGPHAVHGVKPGETLTAGLPLWQEKQLVEAGHLEPAKQEAAHKPAPTTKGK